MASEEQRPQELVVEVREGLVELRTRVGHVESEVAALRADLRAEVGGVRGEFRTELAELRSEVRAELAELRQDIRRLDTRVFQLLLAQLATLATAMGALVATLAG
jgi:uncharacterized protein involved in exopolysaccharide biosynthesis